MHTRLLIFVLLSTIWLPAQAQLFFPLDSSSTPERPVYATTQQQPSFPGGMSGLTRYIQKNLHYPLAARKAKLEGRVYLTFIINEEGAVEKVHVLKGVAPTLDAQAIRLVRGMPNWMPGKIDGQAVACRYNLPVNFSL